MGCLPQSLAVSQVCNGNDFPNVWMDAQMYRLQPAKARLLLLLLLLLSSAALSRGEGDVKRQASNGVHLAALFADHGMHTGTPNHTAVNGGGLGMERFKVNKHLSPLAETASGYVHLGCVPAALFCPQLPAAIFKWLW